VNLTPTVDDRPFFFQLVHIGSVFDPAIYGPDILVHAWSVIVLGFLLIIVFSLCISFIAVPLWIRGRRLDFTNSTLPILYFSSIGLGFMFIEISQMERFSVFLGHPVYGFTVSLFSLLLASGLGSLTTGIIKQSHRNTQKIMWAIGLPMLLIATALLTPMLTHHFANVTTPTRIAIACIVLAAPGFFMGMSFPLGFKTVEERFHHLTPWFWGINGAMSVMGSVLSLVVSTEGGISMAYWTGVVCYGIAMFTFFKIPSYAK
jgi:hypothetical protein